MKKLLIIAVVVGIVAAILVFRNKTAVAPENGDQIVCIQDAKECPDGSFVSRQGPNCEFAQCPTASPAASSSIKPSPSPKSTGTFDEQNPTIIFFDNNFFPGGSINIRVGETVKFINNDAAPHWPASGPHPTHTICSGFDSLRGLKTGETYSFTFNSAKTCPWHDHLKPSINGQIVVSP